MRYTVVSMADSEQSQQAPVRFDEEQNLGSRGGAAAWAEYAVTRALLGSVSRMPYFLQRLIGNGVARLAMRFDKRHREAAKRYMSQALGEEIDAHDPRIRAAYAYLFRISIDADAFDRRVPQDRVLEHFDITSAEGVMEALSGTGGGIMVTSHIGDWEAGAATMPHIGMVPSYVIARPPKNRYLSRHLLRVRERKGLTVIPRRGGMRQIAAILEGGGWIAMLLDQRPSGKHAVAPFFGKLARCERSAAVLMKRLGVPIVFGACYLTDKPFRYQMDLPRMIVPEELESLSVDEVVALVNREQEKLILRHPEQYFWLHDRYRDAPEPESSLTPASPKAGQEVGSEPNPPADSQARVEAASTTPPIN